MSGFGERLTQRQKAFKKGVDADEARRKREDAAVQLRKQTKDEALQKKRFVDEASGGGAAGDTSGDAMTMSDGGAAADEVAAALHRIPAMAQQLASEDPTVQYDSTLWFRKLLSIEQNPPISEVIAAGVVPRLVHFLKEVGRPQLQFESAWVLTNIASGTPDQTRVVVEHGALPILVQLLQSPADDVREQAVWALGNIAGDSTNFRDLVLQSGGLQPVMTVLRESEKTSVMRNATWTLSNLCRGKPPPPFDWVSPALGTLANLIYSSDVEVLTDACWALSYLSDGTNDRITAVIQAGVCRRLAELLLHSSPLVQTPALRAVGNIVTGDDHQTHVILHSGALPSLLKLLNHSKKSIRREACWTVSNINAGNREQIQEVISNGIIPHIIHLLLTADFDVKKEAAWAITNATTGGSPQQIEYLVDCGCIKPMVELLDAPDQRIAGVALECLENCLRVGKQRQQEQGTADNVVAVAVEQCDGLSKIEALQENEADELYQKAMKLLETYFHIEDAEISVDPSAQANSEFGAQIPQGGFAFGGQT